MDAPREYIEFYRLDLSSATRGILIPAASLISVGSLFVCVAAARFRISIGVPRDLIGFFGASVVLVGLVMGFGGMARLLFREGFVGLTLDGIHVRFEARDDFVPWGDLDAIRCDARGRNLELVLRDASSVLLPAVSGPKGLLVRDRIEHLRRKASLNLLVGPCRSPQSLPLRSSS